jgi:CBS domain-containing protein
MRAQELMARPVVVVREDATLEEIAQLMLRHRIGCVPVVGACGTLCGIVTDSDFAPRECRAPFEAKGWAYLFGFQMLGDRLQRIYESARTRTAAEVMSRHVVTAAEGDDIVAVVNKMLAYNVHHVPVVRDGVPVGMVARHGLLLMTV